MCDLAKTMEAGAQEVLRLGLTMTKYKSAEIQN